MAFFVVTMSHPDGEEWGKHLADHMGYLKSLLKAGTLRASGPIKGHALRSGFLIVSAQSREDVEGIVSKDPFARHGLVASLTINEWDPVMGMLHDESSRSLPAWGEAANDSWRLPDTVRKQ